MSTLTLSSSGTDSMSALTSLDKPDVNTVALLGRGC